MVCPTSHPQSSNGIFLGYYQCLPWPAALSTDPLPFRGLSTRRLRVQNKETQVQICKNYVRTASQSSWFSLRSFIRSRGAQLNTAASSSSKVVQLV